MDPLTIGATVLPFIILVLQSIKETCGAWSTYKDGREQITRLDKNIDGLLSTLETLSTSHGITENRDAVLATKIQACADDIKTYEGKLKKLAVDGTAPMAVRQWKKLKTFFSAKEMDRLSTILSEHTVTLSLHLNTVGNDILFKVRDQVGAVEGQRKSIQQSILEKHAAVIDHQTTMTATIQETVATTIHEAVAQVTTENRNNNEALLSAVQGQGLRSKEQSDQSLGILKEILEKLARLSIPRVEEVQDEEIRKGRQSEEGQQIAQPPTEDTPVEDVLPFAELEAGINAILVAFHNKQGVFSLDEAEDLGEALVALLQAMASEDFLASSKTYESMYNRWCETCTKNDIAQLHKSLRAAQRVALSSYHISVNDNGKRKRQDGVVVNSRWGFRSYNLSHGGLSIASSERESKRRRGHSQDPSLSETVKEHETRISFLPRLGPSSRQGFQAILQQDVDAQGAFNAIPRLLINNVLPFGSPVFSLVKEGRMAEFKEMLISGKASLRDQDEGGASLLHYASNVPEMCRFLLAHGVDPNHIGKCVGPFGIILDCQATALTFTTVNDEDADADELKLILECRGLVLEAGCDPTTPIVTRTGHHDGDMLSQIFHLGVVDSIRVLLDHNIGFFTINDKLDEDGSTPLHMLCDSGRYSVESLSFLVGRGADIHALDNYGRTCLHFCFSPLVSNSAHHTQRARDALLYLLGRGADPRAVDNLGRSVSDCAYRDLYHRSSLPEDLWDAVLICAGYDTAEFRQGQLRVAKYTWTYTSDEFEELWSGREHLCPYYHDVEAEDSEADEPSDSDEGGVEID